MSEENRSAVPENVPGNVPEDGEQATTVLTEDMAQPSQPAQPQEPQPSQPTPAGEVPGPQAPYQAGPTGSQQTPYQAGPSGPQQTTPYQAGPSGPQQAPYQAGPSGPQQTPYQTGNGNPYQTPGYGYGQPGAGGPGEPRYSNYQNPGGRPPRKPVNKKLLTWIGVGVGAVVLVLVFLLVWTNRRVTINLNDYLQVDYSGYNSSGDAEVSLNETKFKKDHPKLKLTSGGQKELDKVWEEEDDEDDELFGQGKNFVKKHTTSVFLLLFDMDEYAELDKSSELSNGDTISVTWDPEGIFASLKEYEEVFKVKFKYSDTTLTVEGLEEPEKVDVFEGLTLEFSGTEPEGEAYAYDEGDHDWYVSFDVEPSEGLSNGDKVTVTADWTDSDTELYGVMPETLTKEYTVEGLDSRVASFEDIPTDLQEAMKSDGKKKAEQSGEYYSSRSTFLGCDEIGYYFVKATDGTDDPDVYMLYKMRAEEEGFGKFSYYYAVEFSSIQPDTRVSDLYPDPVYTMFYTPTGGFYDGYTSLQELYDDIEQNTYSGYEIEDHSADTDSGDEYDKVVAASTATDATTE